ncbi:MAG: hypothetical protein ISR58_12720 [Anaerolineales bacterium]|nr:hypothetical protein [Chloroflexota bacterium]MBL6982042.1 hypothetical protein [Anaerolineales bacterium]
MQIIQTLPPASQISLYVLLALIGLFSLLVFGWQIMILQGKAMQNPDGTSDDYHEQKTHFGIAFADVFLACPASFTAIALVFISPRWGMYLLSMIAFWFVWANLMTTATSLKFENPKLTLKWIIVFPTGIFIGLATILWTVVNFDIIYFL